VAGHLSIRLLGRFEVEVEGGPVPLEAWRQRRAAAVVKLLALAPGRRLTREQLIEALWPDRSPEHAGGNLRKARCRAAATPGIAASR
jgi:DNA-binding SARP family transcriptional activator